VVYRVVPTAGGLKEEDINVFMTSNPGLDVNVNSTLYATVSSPLAHLLTDYRNLRNAQLRRSYADAWNTTAHLISTFKPKMVNQDDPTQYLMDFVNESHFDQPAMLSSILHPSLEARNWFERDILIRRQLERPSAHCPNVFTLPRDHELVPQVMLNPCEDIAFLLDKFRRDVCSILGVPYEMIASRESGRETVRKTMASGRIFGTNMSDICRQCQDLLSEVYGVVYSTNPKNVKFILTPMPRLEVESVEDFKILFEIGALTPDMSIELSRVLLGSAVAPRKRKNDDNSKNNKEENNNQEKNSGDGSVNLAGDYKNKKNDDHQEKRPRTS
jgi:hypothetical protein